ncbi:MAG: Phytoene dehydrogenase and related proteins, partial [uncultured Solirubrobacteraceae bacterium]
GSPTAEPRSLRAAAGAPQREPHRRGHKRRRHGPPPTLQQADPPPQPLLDARARPVHLLFLYAPRRRRPRPLRLYGGPQRPALPGI